jgi:iron complex transport system ATP-binding protein
MNQFLKLDSVSFGYNHAKVIDNITLEVKRGDFTGIIGPNGAGKTTLFKVITRVLKPWNGSITYKDKNISATGIRELAREIASVPQVIEAPFSFTVGEFVLMGRYPHSSMFSSPSQADLDIVNESLELTDAIEFKDRTLDRLSGGERQRVILAQALAQKPELLLLDEPTSHLDIGHQIAILDVVKKLNKKNGLTVIMVIHDLNLASEYCDQLILLDGGRVKVSGHPQDVIKYDIIEQVYKTVVVVKNNPISNKPYVIPIPKIE